MTASPGSATERTGPWLVTGAAGFLGCHLVERLLAGGATVVGLDDLSRGRIGNIRQFQGNARFQFFVADVRETSALRKIVSKSEIRTVAHLAALHYIPDAEADPPLAVSINVLGTQSLLTACRDTAVSRFFFASTGDIYPMSDAAQREDAALDPFNVYGLTKVMGERLLEHESRCRPETRFVVGRLFNLYGARETNPHFLPEALRQLREAGDRILKMGNLWPRRDLVPVADAARAVLELTEKAEPGLRAFNVATGVAVSMEELLQTVSAFLPRPVSVVSDPARARKVERATLLADVSRLRQRLGWTPSADLRKHVLQLLLDEGFPAVRPADDA